MFSEVLEVARVRDMSLDELDAELIIINETLGIIEEARVAPDFTREGSDEAELARSERFYAQRKALVETALKRLVTVA